MGGKIPVSKLFISDYGYFFVSETSRAGEKLVGGWGYSTYEEAMVELRKCEEDEEYKWNRLKDVEGFGEDLKRGMTKYEKVILLHLRNMYRSHEGAQSIHSLAHVTNMTEKQVRVACRALRRRGYARYYWAWKGGYGPTFEGLSLRKEFLF